MDGFNGKGQGPSVLVASLNADPRWSLKIKLASMNTQLVPQRRPTSSDARNADARSGQSCMNVCPIASLLSMNVLHRERTLIDVRQ